MLDYPNIDINYEDLDKFCIDYKNDEAFSLTIYKKNIKYEFIIKLKQTSQKMLVLGSGAYDMTKLSPPIYNRIGWINDFDCNLIYYNDPTLYFRGINLGWAYGDKDTHYAKEISDIISVLLRKLNIKNEDTYFYGSSGGGFISIMLATMIKNSTAIANNPQTSIIKYFKVYVDRLFSTIYGEYDEKTIEENKYRISLVDCMKKYNNVPRIYFLQNMAYEYDVINHVITFIQDLQYIVHRKNIHFIFYHDEIAGHDPISKRDTINLINSVMNNNNIEIVDIPNINKK